MKAFDNLTRSDSAFACLALAGSLGASRSVASNEGAPLLAVATWATDAGSVVRADAGLLGFGCCVGHGCYRLLSCAGE